MAREKESMEYKIREKKRREEMEDNFELPHLHVKSKDEALEEIFSTTAVTEPIMVADYFEAQSGVTLVENGRTKTNNAKRVFKFNKTGTIRMNKMDFETK